MAREIQTGINKILENIEERNNEQVSYQWRALRNKIDSSLLSTNVIKSDDARTACQKLDNMTPEQREEYILQVWGPNHLDKVQPLLHQLNILEN